MVKTVKCGATIIMAMFTIMVLSLTSCTEFVRTGEQEFEIVAKDIYVSNETYDEYGEVNKEYVFLVTVGWHDLAIDKFVERVFAVHPESYKTITVGEKRKKLNIEYVSPF